MTEEIEIIEAEVIEANNELKVAYSLPEISDNLSALSAYVDVTLEPYIGWEIDVSDSKKIKEAKKAIAELPKIKTSIDSERKRIKAEYDAPYKAWESRVKEVTNKIDKAYRAIKDQIDNAEEQARQDRRETLEQVYEEFCPLLVPMVPFEEMLDPKWLNASFGEKKAENELCDKAAKIAKDWDILKNSNLQCPTETELEFFKTLDVSAALAYDKQRAEEIARLQELKAEVEPQEVTQVEKIPEPLSRDETIYRFSIEIPRTEFETNENEARALKNHLELLGIKAKMTRFIKGE